MAPGRRDDRREAGFVSRTKRSNGHTRNNRAQKDDDTDLLIRMTNPHYFDGAGKP